MDRREATDWVLRACRRYLRLSQAKTLSECVPAAMGAGRASLAAIGRRMIGPKLAKGRIKRVWRFVSNHRILVAEAMGGVIHSLSRRRRKALLIALDWTEIRRFSTLMAAAVIRGRAIPLLWASYSTADLYRSRNNLEEGLLRLLRSLIPQSLPVILLADRGFGRTELARTCQELGIHYVIRISPEVWIEHSTFRGRLLDYPVRRGISRLLRGVRYRKERPVRQHVVVHWRLGLPARRDEPWFLMTDLDRSPEALCDLYSQRMTIEQLFRDLKGTRQGYALRQTLIRRPERIDRLLVILAWAYLLVVGMGLLVGGRYRSGHWCSSNAPGLCSAFSIGFFCLGQRSPPPAILLAAVVAASKRASPNWG